MDQVSHSGKNTVLYNAAFKFLEGDDEKIKGSVLNGSKHYPSSILP
jgi:hypothetical protein